MTKVTKNKVKFMMDTNWMFQGAIDSEEKEYRLLSYFQKLNKYLEDMKIYPMFTELTLHLGNIQTIAKDGKLIYTDKKLSSFDDEFLISDLKYKNLPNMSEKEIFELQKILNYSYPKFLEYFGITKSFWGVVYNSIQINVKKNKSNMGSKVGYFYYRTKEKLYVWKYSIRRVNKTLNQIRTNISLVFESDMVDLTNTEIISNIKEKKEIREKKLPIFEIVCNEIFPIEETLIPIFKRKIMALINQSVKKELLLTPKKTIDIGIS